MQKCRPPLTVTWSGKQGGQRLRGRADHSALRALYRFCSSRSACSALRCSHSLVPRKSSTTMLPFTQTAQVGGRRFWRWQAGFLPGDAAPGASSGASRDPAQGARRALSAGHFWQGTFGQAARTCGVEGVLLGDAPPHVCKRGLRVPARAVGLVCKRASMGGAQGGLKERRSEAVGLPHGQAASVDLPTCRCRVLSHPLQTWSRLQGQVHSAAGDAALRARTQEHRHAAGADGECRQRQRDADVTDGQHRSALLLLQQKKGCRQALRGGPSFGGRGGRWARAAGSPTAGAAGCALATGRCNSSRERTGGGLEARAGAWPLLCRRVVTICFWLQEIPHREGFNLQCEA